jgi:hypothetical protein
MTTHRRVVRAIRGALPAAGVGVLLALLATVPVEQRLLYLAGSIGITVLASFGLLQLHSSSDKDTPR